MRLAVPLPEIRQRAGAFRNRRLTATALAFLPPIFLAALFARAISRKPGRIIFFAGELARGNFRVRLTGVHKGELGILSRQLRAAGEHLSSSGA